MNVVTIHKAKTNLSELLKKVEQGEEIIIARGSKEIARLLPIASQPVKTSGIGAYKHIPPILSEAMFEPLPEEELAAFEGKHGFDP
jgi:prevent-host-death family protein